MRLFACLLDEVGRGIGDAARRAYESLARKRGLDFDWQLCGHGAVLTAWDDPFGDPMVVSEGNRTAVGVARLDNRPEIERLLGAQYSALTDMELVLRAFTRRGTACLPVLLGDFAFVTWDETDRVAVAACDALSIKKIYYTRRNGLLSFADRAEALAAGDRYDVQYLAERVAVCESSQDRTVYEGVRAVPGGTVVTFQEGRTTLHRYWSPEQCEPLSERALNVPEAAAALRELVLEAVRCRIGYQGDTWSQLSGGVDSSAIAGAAQWLEETGVISQGLRGTVTYVDRQGTAADERTFSNLVAHRWRLRNEAILDPPLWTDERYDIPRLDQPRGNFMHYPREYRLCQIVRQAGGRVLLTGQGPDEYLRGSMLFFADWIAQGRFWDAVREMARRSAIGRVSFWELAYRNAVTPLLPGRLRQWLGPEVTRLPQWLHPDIVRRFQLHKHGLELGLYAGRPGEKYHTSIVKGVLAVQRTVGHLVLDDVLDVRHPFLDRRLVEFGLHLPPDLVVRPYAGKWLLREAMRGLLPEPVRTRVGKATMGELYAWSFINQRPLLAPLTENPILAELGIIDGAALRAVYEGAPSQPQRRGDPHGNLQHVLAIEAWLQIRDGRWPREGLQRTTGSHSARHGSPEPNQGGTYEEDLRQPGSGDERQRGAGDQILEPRRDGVGRQEDPGR